MKVKPSRTDLIVGFPGRPNCLSKAGEEVPRDSYWMRRLSKGDVVLVTEQKPRASKPASRSRTAKPPGTES